MTPPPTPTAPQAKSAALQVYTAKERREDPVRFDGPPGYVGPMPAADGGRRIDGAAGANTLRTGIDDITAIQRLSRDVYANDASAAREDMANEITSASIAQAKHGASPRILVTADNPNRSFSVEGIDSMGCTWEAFTRAMSVIGATTNDDPSMAGQMGMGFFANTLLSDTILFDSHARHTGERFTAMCKGGTEWQVGLRSAPMPHYGVKVSMTVRRRVSLKDLVAMVCRCSLLSPAPVFVRDESGTTELPRFCCAKSLARFKLAAALRSEHNRTTLQSARSYADKEDGGQLVPDRAGFARLLRDRPYEGCVFIHGEKDGVEVCAVFVSSLERETDVVGRNPRWVSRMIGANYDVHAYLVGMPIRLKYDEMIDPATDKTFRPDFTDVNMVVVNVKDERLYRPTADRERFDDETQLRICKTIDAIIREKVSAIRWPTTLAEYLRSPYRAAMDMVACSGRNLGRRKMPEAFPDVPESSVWLVQAGMLQVRNGFDRKRMSLHHAVEAFPNAILASKADARLIVAVARHDPSSRVIVTGQASKLADAGLETIEAYMERNGVAPMSPAEVRTYTRTPEWEKVSHLYGIKRKDKEDDGYGGGSGNDNNRQAAADGQESSSTALPGIPGGMGEGTLYAKDGNVLDGSAAMVRAPVGKWSVAEKLGLKEAREDGDGDSDNNDYDPAGRGRGRSRRRRHDHTRASPDASLKKPGMMVVARRRLQPLVGAMRVSDTNWMVENPAKDIHSPGEALPAYCIDEDDFLAEASSAAYHTSMGDMAGRDIAAYDGRIALFQYDGPAGRLASSIGRSEWFGAPGTLYVACNGLDHFRLTSLLGAQKDEAPDGQDVRRILALKDVPTEENRKNMLPAGAPVLLKDEIAECEKNNGGTMPSRARIAAVETDADWKWMDAIDLLLACLELKSDEMASAFAAAVRPVAWGKGIARLHTLLDGALEADSADIDRNKAPMVIVNLSERDIDASNNFWGQAKRWLLPEAHVPSMDFFPYTTVSEIAARAEADRGRTYHTNRGTMSHKDIVAEAAKGVAVDAIVYGDKAEALANAMPHSAENIVAVVQTCDTAIELACSAAMVGTHTVRMGMDDDSNTGSIMSEAVPIEAFDGPPSLREYGAWKDHPAGWHALLTVRNPSLRALLAALFVGCQYSRHMPAGVAAASAWMMRLDRGDAGGAVPGTYLGPLALADVFVDNDDEDGKGGSGRQEKARREDVAAAPAATAAGHSTDSRAPGGSSSNSSSEPGHLTNTTR